MMLDNSSYNKIKLMYELSANIWFIEKHALPDAQEAGDKDSMNMLMHLARDMQKHLEKIQKAMCVVTQ